MRNRLFKEFTTHAHHPNSRVPFLSLIKATGLVVLAPLLVLTVMAINEHISLEYAAFAQFFITIMALMFVRPYLEDLNALTIYVKSLALEGNAEQPTLSFLNNVEALSSSLENLQNTWENNKQQLQTMVDEGRILIDTLPDCLILLDKEYNIIRTNKTTRDVFGGKFFHQTLTEILQDEIISNAAENVLSTREPTQLSYFLGEPYNLDFEVVLTCFPKKSSDKISLVISMHDVTEQKNVQRMLSDFVANASHEIRTPLTSVIGFVETLQTTAKDDPEAQEKFLGIIKTQAERMSGLVQGLLTLSEIEKNVNQPPTETVNIKSILRETQASLSDLADDRGLTINLDIKESLPKIIGDYGELTQVFDNIIGNAIKYSNQDSVITIQTEITDNSYAEKLSMREFDRVLVISVTDESDGVAPQHVARLTERFYRADTARSRKMGGTGLGLSIVKQILDRHHGLLEIQSTLNVGSIFSIVLPLKNKE